jgi:hypothetical protein
LWLRQVWRNHGNTFETPSYFCDMLDLLVFQKEDNLSQVPIQG